MRLATNRAPALMAATEPMGVRHDATLEVTVVNGRQENPERAQ